MSNNSISVSDWNKELSVLLIPNDVILSLYILLGITGNTLVILVYKFRMKKKTDDRYFIPVLALSDLCASVISASFAITYNTMQAEFTNNKLCQAWWFFAAFSTHMSSLLLVIIAVHRYLKVCRPIGTQMSLFWKRFAIVFAICLSIILAGPTPALYGSVEFPNRERNIVGRRCSKLKDVNKAASLAYGAVVIFYVIICICILIGFYGRIGSTIYRHFKYMSKQKQNLNMKSTSGSQDTQETFFDTKETISSDLTCSQLEIRSNKKAGNVIVYSLQNTENGNRKEEKRTEVEEKKKELTMDKEVSNRRVIYKFTVMFIVITIMFLVCYIPKVILVLIEGLNPQFWENFTDSQRAGMLFLYTSYIIHNIANPFIYGFMDTQFRKEVKLLLRCSK